MAQHTCGTTTAGVHLLSWSSVLVRVPTHPRHHGRTRGSVAHRPRMPYFLRSHSLHTTRFISVVCPFQSSLQNLASAPWGAVWQSQRPRKMWCCKCAATTRTWTRCVYFLILTVAALWFWGESAVRQKHIKANKLCKAHAHTHRCVRRCVQCFMLLLWDATCDAACCCCEPLTQLYFGTFSALFETTDS